MSDEQRPDCGEILNELPALDEGRSHSRLALGDPSVHKQEWNGIPRFDLDGSITPDVVHMPDCYDAVGIKRSRGLQRSHRSLDERHDPFA